jgi:hypothetical protein
VFKKDRFHHVQQCTQSGKTEILSLALCACALVRPRERINVIAPTNRQASEMFSRIRQHLLFDHPTTALRVRREPLTQSEIHVWHDRDNPGMDSVITCHSASIQSGGESILGFWGTVNVLDESGSIPDPIYYEKILRMGAAKTSKALLVECGTPHRRNHFYESSIDGRYVHTHIPVEQALDAGAIDSDYYEMVKSRLHPRQIQTWYRAEFPDDSDRLFPASLTEPHIVSFEQERPTPGHLYALGLDFAKSVDKSVFTLGEVIGDTIWERRILPFRHTRYDDQMQALSELCDVFRPEFAFGDASGPGAVCLEHVEKMRVRRVVPVHFSSQKTAIYTNLHTCVRSGHYKFLNHTEALSELNNLEHEWIGPSGDRLRAEAPTHAVEGVRLGDDHADSKALLACAVRPDYQKRKAHWFYPIVH